MCAWRVDDGRCGVLSDAFVPCCCCVNAWTGTTFELDEVEEDGEGSDDDVVLRPGALGFFKG